MKSIIRIFLAGAFLSSMSLSPAADNPDSSPIYDLSFCVQSAMANHPGLSMAQKEVAISDARRRVAGASLLTAVTLKADETRGKADEVTRSPSFLQRSYGVQATQALFSGGKLSADWRRSSLGAEVARLQLEKQRMDVHHAVAEAYWRVVSLEKSLAYYRKTYQELQEDLEKAVRHELSASRSARIELLTTRAQNRECEAAIADTEENLIEARGALLDALGQARQVNFRVPLEIPVKPLTFDEQECLRLARSHRMETRIEEKMMESAVLSRRVSNSGYYPRVDLNGFVGRSGSAFVETKPFSYRKDWNAGVRVTWPIFWSNAKFSTFKEKTSPRLGESSRTETESQTISWTLGDALGQRVERLEGKKVFQEEQWKYDKAQRDMEQDVRLAVRRASSAWKKVEGANAKMEESQQQLKDTRSLLQEDRAHLGDMASSRTRLVFAQAAQAQALAQYHIAVSALNRAIGVMDHFQSAQ